MIHSTGIKIGSFARGLTAALLLGTAIITFSPGDTAYAARNVSPEVEAGDVGESDGGGRSGTAAKERGVPKGFLESVGYTCKYDAQIGMHRCTKAGAPPYVCDGSGTCVMDVYGPPMNQDIVYHGTGTKVNVRP